MTAQQRPLIAITLRRLRRTGQVSAMLVDQGLAFATGKGFTMRKTGASVFGTSKRHLHTGSSHTAEQFAFIRCRNMLARIDTRGWMRNALIVETHRLHRTYHSLD
eukprot:CAMPEP_0184461192 /NCGR_PEP_ID=MMETSP0740-20130409/43561_1 /TAXON_ID=385413 /ORGANISM="Thalassiosira miniscula, Strain CCMP1093" /LENGTH=104 /DNA_ID=CAMNT_0026834749 /DNA_START=209 /DNA_END=523 /DNA_ORIENTATION=-